jgi:hypothetical protein
MRARDALRLVIVTVAHERGDETTHEAMVMPSDVGAIRFGPGYGEAE